MRPLAERMRPETLEDFVGQAQLLGSEAVLRKAIESGHIPSMILWGPPGVGKTTLARIIAQSSGRPFHTISAVQSGVKDVREILKKAERQDFFSRPNPILFIDEIHRFSKSQQDALLAAVEKGTITLIGATTENPSFEVIPALLSRCQVYVLKSLNEAELTTLAERALAKDEYLNKQDIDLQETHALLLYSGGDARKLYNILELITGSEGAKTIVITDELVKKRLQQKISVFDKGGEKHYDIASAMIKSIRGSDPNGALYWMARMIEGGEDPKFIARRLIISAAEDIGLANPNALLIANTAFDAVKNIGMPEGRIILSEAIIYLAASPKSNSAYKAIGKAQQIVREHGDQPIPLHLRNAPTRLMKDLGYSEGYKYSHDFPGHFEEQEYLPGALSGHTLYTPQNNASERRLWERLAAWWKGKYGYKKPEK